MIQPIHVSFVVLTMNRKNELQNALESIIAQNYRWKEIIVIDNHSSDGSPELVQARFPQVQLIQLEQNVGVCGGRNIGIRASHGEIIIFLDDDAVFASPDATIKIVEKFRSDSQIGVVAFQILENRTGTVAPEHFPLRDKTLINSSDEREVSYFCGTCAIRKSLFEQVGEYPEAYFYSGEELDLSVRILESGLKIIYAPQIQIDHFPSSIGRPKGQWFYYTHRNRMWFAFKYFPLRYAFLHSTIWCAKVCLDSLLSGHFTFFLKGLYDGIAKLPALIKHERKVINRHTVKKLKSLSGRLYY